MWMTSLSQFPLLNHPTRKVQNSSLAEGFAAEDRVDTLGFGRVVKLHGAVEQGVVGMAVQVDEGGVGHFRYQYSRRGVWSGWPGSPASIRTMSEIIFFVHSGCCRHMAPASRKMVTTFFSIA